MTFENGVEHRTELDGTAAYVEALHLKRHDVIVAGKAEFTEFGFVTHSKNSRQTCFATRAKAGVRKRCGK